MARLMTSGAEVYYVFSGVSGSDPDGTSSGGLTTTRDTSVFRSGAASFKNDTGAGNSTGGPSFGFGVGTSEIFARAYIRLEQMPASTSHIMGFDVSSGPAARVSSSGLLTLRDRTGGGDVQIGSGSTTLTTGVFYRIEMRFKVGAGATDEVELRVDGSVVQASTGLNIQDGTPATLQVGWLSTAGTNHVNYVDDIAINDSTGSFQNSWPGDGKVVLLVPISDNQRGSWTGGAAGTTNLWQATNNTPPIGTASETDLTQIESADSSPDNATDEYRANLTTYTTAGIGASDTINCLQLHVNHGEDVSTGTKTGKFRLESNPAATGGTYTTFTFGDDISALGTWPTNWVFDSSAVEYNPSVTLGNSPVVALRKTDTGTRVGSVDFVGVYVDYTPATAPTVLPDIGMALTVT